MMQNREDIKTVCDTDLEFFKEACFAGIVAVPVRLKCGNAARYFSRIHTSCVHRLQQQQQHNYNITTTTT